jgi:hypothetical protein
VLRTIEALGTIERIGFWIVQPLRTTPTPPLFPVTSANPPDSLLPTLPGPAVVASFALLPAPTVAAPAGSNPVGFFGFEISVSAGTLQKLADALLPQVRAQAARQGVTVESITVTCTPPNMVATVARGSVSGVGFTLTITETLGLVAAGGATAGQVVPSVTGTAGIDVELPNWLVLLSGIAGVLGFATLFAVTGTLRRDAEMRANNALSVAHASIGGIPPVIPFKTRPVSLLLLRPVVFGGLFPAIVPSWTSLRVTAAGIVGTGTAAVRPRTVADVALALSGPTTLLQTAPGPVQARYTVSWPGIVPDPGTFMLTVSWRGGVVATVVIPITDAGRNTVIVEFPMPTAPAASGETFSLTVSATETSDGDGVTTLVAPAATLRVVIRPRRSRRMDRL